MSEVHLVLVPTLRGTIMSKRRHPHFLSENILIVSVSFKGVCMTRQKVQKKRRVVTVLAFLLYFSP